MTGLAGCLSPESETTTPQNPGLIPDTLNKMSESFQRRLWRQNPGFSGKLSSVQ